ncbi:MAG: glycosyl hydrolase, partial [Chloroflexota bacterium]
YARGFAAAARAIAGRYADLGEEVAYEIWNEGDNPKTPQVSVYMAPQAYALLLDRTVTAIREAAPKARIILGGLATGPREAVDYVNKVQEALGGRLPVDAIGIHPYGRWIGKRPFPGWGFGELAEVVEIFAEALPTFPLWITEIGIPGREKPLPEEILPDVADYMLDLYRQMAARYAGWVEAILWYGWADSMENAGIVDESGRAKPALFKAFREVRDRVWEMERLKAEG